MGYIHRDGEEKHEALRKVIGLYTAKVPQLPPDCDKDIKLFGASGLG